MDKSLKIARQLKLLKNCKEPCAMCKGIEKSIQTEYHYLDLPPEQCIFLCFIHVSLEDAVLSASVAACGKAIHASDP